MARGESSSALRTELEKAIIGRWEAEKTFERSVDQRATLSAALIDSLLTQTVGSFAEADSGYAAAQLNLAILYELYLKRPADALACRPGARGQTRGESMNKLYPSAHEALKDVVRDGMTLGIGSRGFGPAKTGTGRGARRRAGGARLAAAPAPPVPEGLERRLQVAAKIVRSSRPSAATRHWADDVADDIDAARADGLTAALRALGRPPLVIDLEDVGGAHVVPIGDFHRDHVQPRHPLSGIVVQLEFDLLGRGSGLNRDGGGVRQVRIVDEHPQRPGVEVMAGQGHHIAQSRAELLVRQRELQQRGERRRHVRLGGHAGVFLAAREHGQRERGRLAGARLGHADDIASAQQGRDGGALDRRDDELTEAVLVGDVELSDLTLQIDAHFVWTTPIDVSVEEAMRMALIAFTDVLVNSRSFAMKNRYTVDADQELLGLGAASISAPANAATGTANAPSDPAPSAGGRA